MRSRFDRRVVPEAGVRFLRALMDGADCSLAGGAALSGAWLAHRLSRDLDVFFPTLDALRSAVRQLPTVAATAGVESQVVRDGGGLVTATLGGDGLALTVDLVHEPVPQLAAPTVIEGVRVASAEDLRAAKLGCLLHRTEPRDLVDLLFLDRAGHPPEHDLVGALTKDGGIDPATLAWLLRDFPTRPMPQMLEVLSAVELVAWRDELARRMGEVSIPPDA